MNDPWASFSRFESRVSEWDEFSTPEPRQRGRLNALASDTTDIEGVGGRVDVSRRRPEREGRPAHGPRDNLDAARIERRRVEQPATRARREAIDQGPPEVSDTLAHIGTVRRSLTEDDYPFLYRRGQRITDAEIADIVNRSRDQIGGLSPADATQFLFGRKEEREARAPTLAEPTQPRTQREIRSGRTELPAVVETAPLTAQEAESAEWELRQEAVAAAREISQRRERLLGDSSGADRFGRGLIQNIMASAQDITSLGFRAGAEVLDRSIGGMFETPADYLDGLADWIATDAASRRQAGTPEYERGSLPYFAFGTARSMLDLTAAVGVGLTTRNPSTTAGFVMGSIVGGQETQRAIEAGYSRTTALTIGTIYGLSEMVPERIAVETFLRAAMTPGRNAAGRLVRAGATGALSEATQEGVTELIQIGLDAGVYNEQTDLAEAMLRIRDAMVMGAGAGASVATGVAAVAEISDARQRRFQEGVSAWLRDAERSAQTPTLDMAAPEGGIVSQAVNRAPNITPEDVASPIPTDLIAEGRSVIDQAVAGQDADEIASQIGASTGDSVVISLGGMERTGTVRDAFRDDDGEGVLIEWENGSTERQYLADLADAGAKIVRQDTLAPEPLASEATVAPPPRQSEAAERRGQPYFDVILQLEGGTGPNGEFLTSPAGAVGPAQVMPGTAPEAARLAGLPYDERRYRTDREYNIALGRAYYQEQLRVFRDPAMAAAAYNAGPGRVRQALRQAREQGGVWTDYLPAETQAYVENFRERTGEGGMVDFETEEPLQPDYSWMDEAEIGSDREEGVELTGGAQPSVDIEVETPRSMDEAREQLRQAGQGIRDQINAGARRFEQEAAQVVPTLPPQLVQSLRTQIVEGNADLSMPLRVEEADALRAAGASISDTNYLPKAYVDAIRSPERGPIETPSTDRATQQKQIATDAATETIRPEIAVERGNVVLRNLTESDRIRVNEALPTLARVLPRSDGTFVAPKRYEETIRTVLTGDGTRTAPVQVETAEDVRRAEQQVEPPTEAQAEVGNFRHGHVRVQGFDIAIETPKGASRSGVAPDGTRWTLDSMPATYGRIKRSRGADGENVDVYVGSHPQAMLSYVIDQVNPDTREFDESKIMLGYRNREEALADYRAAFSDGRGDERIGAVTVRDVLSLAEWMREPQTGPVGEIGSYRPTTTESEAEIAASPAATQPPAGETPAEAPTQRAAEGAAPAASGTASWVIREKATGQAIMETFDRKKVDALNTAKYEAVPIREHLASLSRGVTESVTPAFDPAPHVETLKAYVGQRGRSLAPQAVARHLGVSEQQAQRVMGALASVPNSGIFVSKRSGKVRRIPRREGPVSLYHFLRDRGGIIDNKDKAKGGRHALAKGRNLTRFPGLINNRDGMPLDEALEAAVEAGYFDTTDRQAYSEDDLLQRLENASREYRPGEAAEALERQSAREGRDDSNREAIRDAALGLAFTEEDLAAAESYMADGLSAEAAVDAAKRDAMAEVLDEGPGDFYAQVAESLYAGEIAEARGPETEPEEGGDRRTAEAEPRPESVERDAGEGGGRTEEPDRAPEAAQQDRELGKNRDGWPLFERPDGTRYFLKHGENFGRDVEMFPPHLTGGRDNLDRSIEYLTEEEIVEKARQRGITLDMFGTREGDERRALERQGEGRKKSDKQQKAPGEDGGLFDVRDTTRDIEEVTRSESNPIAQARSALQQALTALDQAEGVTRRDFIKGGAAVAGGFMIEGRLFAQPPGLTAILDRSMTEAVPLEEAMDWIARNSENRQFRRFAQRIGPLVRGVVLRGGEQGQTEHQDGTPVPEAISLGEAHGMHQVDETTDGDVVWIGRGELVNGFNEGTVLHEALHAAMYRLFGNLSVRLAWNDPRMLREAGFNRETVPRASAADLRALRSLYEDALGAYEAMVRDLALGEDQTERVRRIRNGMADPSEFISYALEDRHMQAFLRERPSREGDKSLWDRVVDFVARVLGISPEPRTALDDVLDTAYRLLNEPGGPLRVQNRPFPDQVPEVNRGLGQEAPMFQRELVGGDDPVFYSALERAVERSPQARASAAQWTATLAKTPGVKKEELEWSGLFEWLEAVEGPVDKTALLAVIRDGGIRVEEVVLGDPNDADVRERVEEIVRTFPGERDADAEMLARQEMARDPQFASWSSDPNNETYRELLITLPPGQGGNPDVSSFKTHWDQEAVIAHTRFMEKRDADGKRVLFIEEIQSDQAQAGRERGFETELSEEEMARRDAALAEAEADFREKTKEAYRLALEAGQNDIPRIELNDTLGQLGSIIRWIADSDQATTPESIKALDEARVAQLRLNEAQQAASRRSEGVVPDMPFKSSWPALVMKRLIRFAVDSGYERVAWTTGDEQNERYSLERHIDSAELRRSAGGIGQPDMGPLRDGDRLRLVIDAADGRTVVDQHIDSRAELEEYLPADVAERLWSAEPVSRPGGGGWRDATRTIRGLDLKTGGEGMRAFYDRNLVNIANDLLKKHGVKVGMVEIETGNQFEYETDEDGNVVEARTNPGFDITSALADAARSGFPLFSQLRQAQSRPVSDEAAQEIAERLQTELERLGISDRITLKAANGLLTKERAQGSYFRRVIQVSLDTALNPDATLNHEAIHAMKALGLFTSSEWTALVKQAWADEGVWTFVNRGYPTAQDSKRDEEAVAEFYSRWRTQRMEAKGFASRALQRIGDFLAALGRAAARVLGKPTSAGTVLRGVESGRIGRRQTGKGVWAESGTPLLQNDAFRRWFGKSKVVDERGQPLVVYHGTPRTFDAFDLDESAENGFFFSASRSRAADFGEKVKVLSVYLSIKNPLEIDGNIFPQEHTREDMEDLIQGAREGGHDGVIIRGFRDFDAPPTDTFIAFEPSQIKSTANRGTFDPDDDRIMFMVRTPTALWNDMLNGARTVTGAAKIPGATDKFWAALDRLRTNMQDRMLPLLRTQTAIEQVAGRELSEEERPYRQEALYTGRVGSQFEQMEDSIINPLFEAMAENKVGVEELESYLYARHAPERNAKLKKEGVENGSGMSDIEAAAIMARIDKAGKTDALKAVASWYDKLIAFALDTRVAGGLMSQETADEWRALYPNYAPLRGLAEMAEAERPNVGKGFTVKGPESKRAFGRKSRAEDLLAYAMVQAEEAIIRAEKNRVAVELYNLAKANPDPNFWQVQKVTMKKRVNPDTGLIESYPVTVLLPEDAPFTVSVKLNGKQSRVTFNKTNPAAVRAAAAMRRLNEPELNVRAFQIINMWLSKANTMLNPDFIWRNAIRDLETAVANLSEFDMKGLRRDVLKSYPKALKAAERGAFKREARNDWDRAWAEFTAEGGRVFYNQIQDVDELRRDINKRFARLTRKKKPTPKEAGLLMWEGLKWTFDKIEKVNLGVENAVRLSAYKNLRDRGVSQKQAAFIAKELTVNFNRRGVYGVLMNSLYLFYNATTQGSVRMMLALRHKRTRKVAMAMIVAGAMNALYNVLASGGDDDEESVYDQLSEYEKSTNMIFMIPGTDRYIKIPVAYGYNIFFEIGRHLVDVGRGRSSPIEASGNWLYTALNSFNPIGGQESLANFIAPTVFDPAVDLMVDNRNFADMPIMPDDSPFEPPVPDSQRYWPSVSPIFRTLTDALNQGTGGDEVVPGWIDVSPESLEYMTGYVTGAAGATIMRFGGGIAKVLDGTPETALEINDVPIARTMTGTTPSWYPRAAFYTRLEHVEEVVGNAREYIANRDREGLQSYRRSEADVLSLRDEARSARREIREIRRARARLDVEVGVGRITDAQRDRARLRLADRESRLIEAWNSIYLRTVESPRRPDR